MTRYALLALFVLGCSGDPGSPPDLGTGGSVSATGGYAGEPVASGGTASGGSAPVDTGGMGGQGGAPVAPGIGDPCETADECDIPGVPRELVICADVGCTFRCSDSAGETVPGIPQTCRDFGDADPQRAWLCIYDDDGGSTCR